MEQNSQANNLNARLAHVRCAAFHALCFSLTPVFLRLQGWLLPQVASRQQDAFLFLQPNPEKEGVGSPWVPVPHCSMFYQSARQASVEENCC